MAIWSDVFCWTCATTVLAAAGSVLAAGGGGGKNEFTDKILLFRFSMVVSVRFLRFWMRHWVMKMMMKMMISHLSRTGQVDAYRLLPAKTLLSEISETTSSLPDLRFQS